MKADIEIGYIIDIEQFIPVSVLLEDIEHLSHGDGLFEFDGVLHAGDSE